MEAAFSMMWCIGSMLLQPEQHTRFLRLLHDACIAPQQRAEIA
ncbi:hypothetical protein [Streptomyces sp. NPDC048473]